MVAKHFDLREREVIAARQLDADITSGAVDGDLGGPPRDAVIVGVPDARLAEGPLEIR